jgi:ribosomal protein L24
LIPLSAYTSDKIIVHSNKAKQEMVEVLNVNKEKIEVVYAGVPEEFRKEINRNTALDFIKKFDKIIDMSILMNNVHMNKPGAIQISSNKNRYFIIAPMSEISNINYVT